MTQYIKDEKLSPSLPLNKVYSVFIGLLPVIMIYKFPFIDKGMSTILLGLFTPYPLIKIFEGRAKKRIGVLLVFALYVLYYVWKSIGDNENMFLMFIVAIHILGAFKDAIDTEVVRKTVEIVAFVAAVLVVVQTILYYVLHIDIKFVLGSFVIDNLKYYFEKSITGLYRPSSIFLEPSHMSQYSCVAIASGLITKEGFENFKIKRVIITAIGTLLTTSGIGIALCIIIFAWYVLCVAFSKDIKRGICIVIGSLVGALVVFLILMRISIFALSVQRIFGEVDGYNAIWGRTLFWESTIGKMKGYDLLFGYGAIAESGNYMTGLMHNLYCYGYIGVGILWFLLIACFIGAKNNKFSKSLCIIYFTLMFVANQSGFINIIFWFSIIVSGMYENVVDKEDFQIE